MQKIEIWIEVKIVDDATGEILYGGNYDEVTSCTLTGQGNDRFGYMQGMENFKKFQELFEKPIEHYVEFESFPHEEYGYVAYSLGEIDYNHVMFKVDTPSNKSQAEQQKLFLGLDTWQKKAKGFVFSDVVGEWENKEPTKIRVEDIFMIVKRIHTEIHKF